MSEIKVRQIVLASRPQGKVQLNNFRLEEDASRGPGPGEVLLKTKYLSLDPYMRGRMDDRKSYAEPTTLGSVMPGERRTVHVGSNERIRIHRLLDRDAANKRRHLARDFIQTTKHYVLAGSLHSRALKQIMQAGTGKTSGAHSPALPLHAGNAGLLKAAAVSSTLQRIGNRVLLHLRQVS